MATTADGQIIYAQNKTYDDGQILDEVDLDNEDSTIDQTFDYTQSNLTQLNKDMYGASNINFSNNGAAALSNSLYNKQTASDTDTGDTTIAATDSWTDVDATNSSLSVVVANIAGKFLVKFDFYLEYVSTNAVNKIDVKFRLVDDQGSPVASTVNARERNENIANGATVGRSMSITHIYDWTVTTRVVKLQYYITSANTSNMTITIPSSAVTTVMIAEKI